MTSRQPSFDINDMARALKAQFDEQIPTVAAARELSEAFFLLMVKALVEGKRVYGMNHFNMILVAPRKCAVTTPTGEPWEGFTRPRLKATLHAGLYAHLQDEKASLGWPKGSLDKPWVRTLQRERAQVRAEAKETKKAPAKAGRKRK